ncbi:GNAT family N-acetyltransferase [Streptomyces mirabilis]|uniref:GNAT family N-acetyltransferase n=1 Tax=Streptomyces mirabilis TaxID=68239 RepID=UPI0036D9AAAD
MKIKGASVTNSAAATSVEVRRATEEDHQWLYELHEQAHRALVERAYGPWKEDQQRAFFAPLVNDHEVFICSDGDRQVGAVYLGGRDGDVWLELVEILPGYQRQGYGTLAVRWVVERASGQGAGTLLQVHRMNQDAHRLYLSEGFSSAGETATHHLMRKSVQ